jgi:hypothetical protein
VLSEAVDLLCRLLKSQSGTGKGNPGTVKQYRSDMIAYIRADEVQDILEHQQNAAEDIEEIRGLLSRLSRSSRTYAKDRKTLMMRLTAKRKLLAWHGDNLDGVKAAASAALSVSPFKGAYGTIHTAHVQVARQMKSNEPNRYYRFHDRFLQKIGLEKLTRVYSHPKKLLHELEATGKPPKSKKK